VDKRTTFSTLVQHVKHVVTEAVANQDVPFEQTVSACQSRARDTSRNPLVSTLFAHHTQVHLGVVRLEGLSASRVPLPPPSTRFDMEFHLYQEDAGIRGEVLFATDLFKSSMIRCVVDVFQVILRTGVAGTPISCLPLRGIIPDALRHQLLQPKSPDYLRDKSIVDIWREQVCASHDAVAVQDNSSQLSYNELDQASDRLAAWLCSQSLLAESLVGVVAPRCCNTIAILLGVLKANLAYLPLDPRAQDGRIDTILSCTSNCHLVILGAGVKTPTVTGIVRFVHMHEISSSSAELRITKSPLANSLAYVMYTSGSTGLPKGVMVEHRGIVRLVKNGTAVKGLPSPPNLRIAHLSNLAFNASTWEIWAALLNGGTLVCLDYETVVDPVALGKAFEHHTIRAAILTPALVRECLEHAPDTLAHLDFLHVGGDRFREVDATAARGLVPIVNNVYGPTENTVLSTIHGVQENEVFANGVTIGTPINNAGAFVMDSRQQLVPFGVVGELVVTGAGLARGYTDAAWNKDRFIKVNIGGEGIRAYRTGDSVRLRPDGILECFRRIDLQVKIRGKISNFQGST
jgi:amino acid adenylation domain-containing protein